MNDRLAIITVVLNSDALHTVMARMSEKTLKEGSEEQWKRWLNHVLNVEVDQQDPWQEIKVRNKNYNTVVILVSVKSRLLFFQRVYLLPIVYNLY